MKHKSSQLMDWIADSIIDQFHQYLEKYPIDGDYVRLHIYPYNYRDIDEVQRCNNGSACTSYVFYYDDDKIVRKVGAEIYIPTERIIMALIDASMDLDKLIDYYNMILLHEIGHVICGMKRFTHRQLDVCHKLLDDDRELEKTVPKLRRNASRKSRIKFYNEFFNLPAEKEANDAVGITIDRIIEAEMSLF